MNQESSIEQSLKETTERKNHSRWSLDWTIQEDHLLFQKYLEMGSKWVELSHSFPSKTDNSIKNRFYCCMRKVQRRMNKIQKEKNIKHKKPIRYDSLLTILEIAKCDANNQDKRFGNIKENMKDLLELREMIIEAARSPQEKISHKMMEDLIDKFVELKFALKFINIQRVKGSVKNPAPISKKTEKNTMNFNDMIQGSDKEHFSQETHNCQGPQELAQLQKIEPSEIIEMQTPIWCQINRMDSCNSIMNMEFGRDTDEFDILLI